MTTHIGSGLALDVQVLRRDLGLTHADVAETCGVSETRVRALENGEVVDEWTALALCHALGLPSTRHVPGCSPPCPVPLDESHRSVMGGIIRHEGAMSGRIEFPDLRARDEAERTVRPGWRHRLLGKLRRGLDVDRATRWGLGCVVISILVPGIGERTGMPRPFSDYVQIGLMIAGIVLMTAPSILGLVWLSLRARGQDRRAEQDVPHGYLLTPSGASALLVKDHGLVQRDTLARNVLAVTCEEHGADHVTLTVEGDQGTFTMPWLRRTRDLSDAVAAWGAPVGTSGRR